MLKEKERKGKKGEDCSINENFDGRSIIDTSQAVSPLVFTKDSVVLISQDDRASGPFLLGSLTPDWEKSTKEAVKTHVYAPNTENCLLFHHEFTGIIK